MNRPPTPFGGALRVLVVEDDETSRIQLREAVESLGHTCASASDGKVALALHREEPFDVVLSDWCMPRMDGITLCRTLREEDCDNYTYFIFITSLADRDHVLLALREGADQYITKPIDFEELAARLVAARRVSGVQRPTIQEDLAAAHAHAARYHHRYALALCDIDTVCRNDSGETLRRVVDVVRRKLRRGDKLYRYGGTKLLVLLPEQDLAGAATAIRRIQSAIKSDAIADDGAPGNVVTISAGVATLDSTDRSVADWFERAQAALHRAKERGLNGVERGS